MQSPDTYAELDQFITIEPKTVVEDIVIERTINSSTDTSEVLAQRGSRYGEFKHQAELSQHLHTAFYQHMEEYNKEALQSMEPYQHEAIKLIMHKLARIANGDPMYLDNYVDICGYSQLVVDELSK